MSSKAGSGIFPVLVKKIHPGPLNTPTTRREAEQLSNTFLKSFRNLINDEHGGDKSTSAHTNVHMASLLNSPHFAGPPAPASKSYASPLRRERSRSSSSSSSRKAVRHLATLQNQSAQRMVRSLQGQIARPVELFAAQVAAGEATFESAVDCMATHDLIGSLKNKSEPRPGAVICNWLHSTGLEESLEFIYHKDFLKAIIKSLYAEQKHGRVDTWLAMIQKRLENTPTDCKEMVKAGSSIMFSQMHNEVEHIGCGSAVKAFNDNLMRANASANVNPAVKRLFTSAGNYLISCLAPSLVFKHQSPVNEARNIVLESDYDQFVHGIEIWNNARISRFKDARLALAHPTQPSEKKAFEMIAVVDDVTLDSSGRAYVDLCMATANWLADKGRQAESERILNGLQDKITQSEERSSWYNWQDVAGTIRNWKQQLLPNDPNTTLSPRMPQSS